MHRLVYFPIEEKNRELESKLLTSAYLVARGIDVVIGVGAEISHNLSSLRPGAFFLKGMNAVQEPFLKELARAGHRIFVIDEEAVGLADPAYMMRDVSERIEPFIDLVFCQGQVQQDALASHRGFPSGKLFVSGNPRLDLLRPEFLRRFEGEAKRIRDQNGRFVLMNSSLSSINSVWGDLDTYRKLLFQIGWADETNQQDLALMEEHIAHDQNNLVSMERFIAELARVRGDQKLVLRPHPTENPQRWIEFARDRENMEVVVASDFLPWLLASDVLVTTGCTTAVEAILAGKKAISIVEHPPEITFHEKYLANHFAEVSSSVEEAVSTVIKVLDAPQMPISPGDETQHEDLRKHVLHGPGTRAYRKIGDRLVAAMADGQPASEDMAQGVFLNFRDDLQVPKVSWERAHFTAEELGTRLNRLLQASEINIAGNIRAIGYGTYLISANPAGT